MAKITLQPLKPSFRLPSMIIAIKQFILFIAIALLSACNASTVEYETYFNKMNDYTVEYPSFLIGQGEATNQDGQKFLSEDGKTQLLVYIDYKNDYLAGGDLYSINEAYEQELKSKEAVFNKKVGDAHYIIEYKQDDILHTVYAEIQDDYYYNFRFEYPEKDQKMMADVISHVIQSLRIKVSEGIAIWEGENASIDGAEDMFPAFLEGFLNDSYWGKNFNALLRNKDKVLAAYIDPVMDLRRYYAPGTVARLASRAEDFGFAREDDFFSLPTLAGEAIFERIASDAEPCSLDFDNHNRIYYQWLNAVPDVVVNMETFAIESVQIAYPNAQIMAVYLPNAYGNPRGFYFINTPEGWKLAFVDDSLCEA